MDTKPHLDLIRQLRTVLATINFLTNRYKHEKIKEDTKSVTTLEELYKEMEWFDNLRDQFCKLPKIFDIAEIKEDDDSIESLHLKKL